MNKYGLLVTLQAKPGKGAEVEKFLQSAIPLVAAEAGTTTWFALKLKSDTFGIFDTFKDQEARKAHLGGELARELFRRAEDLFVAAPTVQSVDILAETLRSQ